jgi:hypothetical protein
MKKIRDLAVLTLCNAAGLLTICALLIYTAQNHSGHTGLNPYHAITAFISLGITGLIYLLTIRCLGYQRWLSVSAILIGLLGVTVLVWLDRSNTLLQYEVWIERGMPER